MNLQLFILCCIWHLTMGWDDPIHKIGPSHYMSRSKDAPDSHSPFQCSLQKNRKHFCGCAIIAPEWIITTAECLCGMDPTEIDIMVGSNIILNGTFYQANKIIMHERYNKPECANNIGLLRVEGKIEFGRKVLPINITAKEILEGRQIEITGWGQLGRGNAQPTHLQLLRNKALSISTCKSLFPQMSFLQSSHFCSIPKYGYSTCYGDEGSPVVMRDTNGPILAGIVVYPACQEPGDPDAFTKISYFYSWIKSNTGI